MKPMFKRLFIVEGNIGAGKSTLLNLLEKSFQNIYVIYEPVDKWTNIAGSNLLGDFYSTPQSLRYGLISWFPKILKIGIFFGDLSCILEILPN